MFGFTKKIFIVVNEFIGRSIVNLLKFFSMSNPEYKTILILMRLHFVLTVF